MHLIKPATTAPLAFLSWWLVMSGVVGAIIEMLVIGSVPLGPWILPAVISAALFVLVLAFGAMLWLLRIGKSVPSESDENRWTKKHTASATAVAVCFAIWISLGGIADREFEEWRNRRSAERGHQIFAEIGLTGRADKFDEEAVNKTLAELEESYRKLKPEWILPDNHNIRVNLFADMETYRILTHSHAAGGHVSCKVRGPIISIPLENAPEANLNDSFTSTPAHEMAHALVCLSTGPEKFR